MKITCPCERVTLSLPDDKLPPSGRFLVGCPECGKRVRITRSAYGTESAFADPSGEEQDGALPGPVLAPLAKPQQPTPAKSPAASKTPGTTGAGQAPGKAVQADAPASAEPPAAPAPRFIAPRPIPPDRPSAFIAVADANILLALKTYFRDRGHYQRRVPGDPEEAAADLRINRHALFLIEDLPEFKPLLSETLSWNGDRRRETAVILLGVVEDFDPKSAFCKGVDSVLNKTETADLSARLDAAINAFRRRANRRKPAS